MAPSQFLNPTEVIKAAGIRAGALVADFGAGSGFFTRAAARAAGHDGVVWAVDAHRDLLPRIKHLALGEGLHNVEVIHGDLEQAGGSHLPAAHFDWVIAANLLFGVGDKEALVREIARVLRKSAKALVVDWSGSHGGLGPHPGHVVEEHIARDLFEKAGFTYLGEIPAGAYHWGFVVRKNMTRGAQ